MNLVLYHSRGREGGGREGENWNGWWMHIDSLYTAAQLLCHHVLLILPRGYHHIVWVCNKAAPKPGNAWLIICYAVIRWQKNLAWNNGMPNHNRAVFNFDNGLVSQEVSVLWPGGYRTPRGGENALLTSGHHHQRMFFFCSHSCQCVCKPRLCSMVVTFDLWHVTYELWHVTYELWHVTYELWPPVENHHRQEGSWWHSEDHVPPHAYLGERLQVRPWFYCWW